MAEVAAIWLVAASFLLGGLVVPVAGTAIFGADAARPALLVGVAAVVGVAVFAPRRHDPMPK